jgi:hypothetical protein
MESTYTKISRNGFLLRLLPGIRHDLYLGPDHLLLVEQVVFVERYKRFYYTDIQYISVAKSGRSIGFTITFAILLIFSLPFFLGWQYPVLLGIAIVLTAIFGSLLVYNLMLGPSCLVQIKTATDTAARTSSNLRKAARRNPKANPRRPTSPIAGDACSLKIFAIGWPATGSGLLHFISQIANRVFRAQRDRYEHY